MNELMVAYAIQTRSGRVFPGSLFTLSANRARIPDVAWISRERFSQVRLSSNDVIPVAPDIAVEVISDSEEVKYSERKLRDYLEAGVEVWRVFPESESVTLWRGKHGHILSGQDAITSELLPGFSVPMADLFVDLTSPV